MGHDNARLVGPNSVKGNFQGQAILCGNINVSYGGPFQGCWGLFKMFTAPSLVL